MSNYKQWDTSPEMSIDPGKTYRVSMNTNRGEIQLELYPEHAPKTVNNFVFLAREGFYDGVSFHRVIEDFVIQGGDPTGSGMGGPGYKFEDETAGNPLTHQTGVISMANAGPNTNGSQFFLISGPSGVGLPPQYSLFGKIVKGLDVLDEMQRVPTGPGDRPLDDVVIHSVTITEHAD